MRRLLSLVLLAALGLPVVAPALALGQDTEASLPACCRRHGVHHCSMGNMQRPSSSAPAFSERCPYFPQPSNSVSQITTFALHSPPQLIAASRSSLIVHQPASLLHSSTHDFALYKRGPPSHLLA